MKPHRYNPLARIFAIVLCAGLFSVFGIGRMPQLIVIFALAVGAVWFILKKVDSRLKRAMATLFLVTFFIQIAISLLIYNQTLGTKYGGFSFKGDDYVYGDFGTIVGGLWRRGFFSNLIQLKKYNLVGKNIPPQAYQLYNAVIFYLFGQKGGQILLIINCFLHVGIIIPAYFIFKRLNIRNSVMIFGFTLFLFWPSTFYWSLFNFREPMILFSIFAIFALLQAEKSIRTGRIVILVALNLTTYLLRQYLAIVAVSTILYYFIFVKWKRKRLIILIIVFLILLAQLLKEPDLAEVAYKIKLFPTLTFGLRHASAACAYSEYFANLLSFTYPSTCLYLPFGVSAVMFLPFLMRPFSITQVASNIESILWWCLIPFLVNGIWISMRRELKKTFPILFVFFSWIIILALTQGNMGTLIRQKAIVYYAAFVFIILAIDRNIDRTGVRPFKKDG